MLTVKEYLLAAGLDCDPDRIKLVKHVDQPSRKVYMREIIDNGAFDFFQSEQGFTKKPFHNCDLIISFIGLENQLAELWGVYKVKGCRKFNRLDMSEIPEVISHIKSHMKNLIRYDLEEITLFQPLCQRLIVRWISTRGWVPGVNNYGKSGRWAFAEFTDVYEMQTDFKEKVEAEFNKMIEDVLKSNDQTV